MSYKTLYRTYRPQNFHDVVGQVHITKTFMNALSKDKVSHAYLFTGPRGTGKTSIAKIIAKAVNCEKAPSPEPCNECSSCTSINSGFDSDVFEIDAASNNGVDEIREIRDKVKYAPSAGRYKVYIIDEVHMLSTGAFNALLKTLEEPPKHAIFILATTEPHKIPATIISRCQRFDFRSISLKDMIKRIKYIADEEKIQIEEKAILTIAKSAQGGMRDALSLLDQVISYSDDIITEQEVHEIAGSLSEDSMSEIVLMLIEGKPQISLEIIDELVSLGKETLRLVENLIYYFRDIFLLQKLQTVDPELIANHSEKTQDLATVLNSKIIYQIIAKLNEIQYEMRKTNNPRVFLELAVFELYNIINQSNEFTDDKPVIIAKVEEPKQPEEKPSKEEAKPERVTPSLVKNNYEEKYIDVRDIEDILNNGSKDKRIRLLSEWKYLYGNDLENIMIEQILIDGQVQAVSNNNQILLSYEHDETCSKLYEPLIYKKALELLYNYFKEDFSLIAIPLRIWEDKRDEFMEQFRKNVKEPKLSPITEPIIVRNSSANYEHEPEMVKEAINLFGEDIVKIK